MKYDVYLTSTLTNQWNVKFNHVVGNQLEKTGIKMYLPHRDTNQSGSPKEIFDQDLQGINVSSCVLAIAKNESPNWGAELGYAYANKKPVIALLENSHEIPLICNGMVSDVLPVKKLDDVNTYISELEKLLKKYFD